MIRRSFRFSPALLCLPLWAASVAHAQSGVSPEAAPAAPESVPPQLSPSGPQSETTPVNPPPISDENAPNETTAPDSDAPARLLAASVTYENGITVARGTSETPVRFESAAGLVTAREVRLDIQNQKLMANGDVNFERDVAVSRRELRPRRLSESRRDEIVRETAFGQNLIYDFKTGQGQLDNARLRLATLTITTENLVINGKSYRASNVVLRPGGLSEEELKIYGTPPFSLHARSLTAVPIERNGKTGQRVTLRGGGLYFKKTRILPVPSYSFTSGLSSGNSQRITPGISFNSADRLLLTTEFTFPINKTAPERLSARADLGLSARVGLRGGVGVTSSSKLGYFALDVRRNDVVSSQLTNRIALDRKPEFVYRSPAFLTFDLAKRRAGFAFDGSVGEFTERFIGSDRRTISSSRSQARILFSTRLEPGTGAFLRLFSSYSQYGSGGNYRNNGFEVGYEGLILPRTRGQISLRSTDIRGDTPFTFDRVEIKRELRATVDYQLSPRYILPFDLRYDLQSNEFRDATFGLLRSYKTFAYGVTYQTARKDLKLEVRQGF